MFRIRFVLSTFVLLVVFRPANILAEIPFPSAQEQWLNSRPVSADAVKDKVVLLWFYEEG